MKALDKQDYFHAGQAEGHRWTMLRIPRFSYCEPYLFVVPLQPKSRTIK